MRAIYYNLKKTDAGTSISITGDRAHHLNVVRIKRDEEILVLNGNGESFKSIVEDVSKNEVVIKVQSYKLEAPKHKISLAIALPKKDAFEDILKMAVELGINKIYPLSSEFSQYEYLKSDRIERLIESALIQSNNLYMPTIETQDTLDNFLKIFDNPIVYFSAKPNMEKVLFSQKDEVTILIGPEAGLSAREEEVIFRKNKLKTIHLPTPILRSSTAVASSIGYLLNFNS